MTHARPPNQPTGNSSAPASHPREAKRTARKINVGEINAATLRVLKSGRAGDAASLLDKLRSSLPSPRPSLDSTAYPVPVVSTIRHDDPRHRLTPRTVSSSGPLPDIICEHSAGGDRGQLTAVRMGGKRHRSDACHLIQRQITLTPEMPPGPCHIARSSQMTAIAKSRIQAILVR